MIQNIKTHKKWVDVVKSCANLFFTNKTLDLIRILFSLNLDCGEIGLCSDYSTFMGLIHICKHFFAIPQ